MKQEINETLIDQNVHAHNALLSYLCRGHYILKYHLAKDDFFDLLNLKKNSNQNKHQGRKDLPIQCLT